MSDFKRYLLGEFQRNEEYDFYVGAWTAYHLAAEKIDGHIKQPISFNEMKLVKQAGDAGKEAMRTFFNVSGMTEPDRKINRSAWNLFIRANNEAQRRLELMDKKDI